MSDNYIVINGKKAELTDEQMKALGIEPKVKSPFSPTRNEYYYHIRPNGVVNGERNVDSCVDKARYNVANYCADKELMEQRALHETLNRLLWRYSMEHDGDKIDWNCADEKYYIYYGYIDCQIAVGNAVYHQLENVVYFRSDYIANAAIKDIIEPFMKEHPDFVW